MLISAGNIHDCLAKAIEAGKRLTSRFRNLAQHNLDHLQQVRVVRRIGSVHYNAAIHPVACHRIAIDTLALSVPVWLCVCVCVCVCQREREKERERERLTSQECLNWLRSGRFVSQ